MYTVSCPSCSHRQRGAFARVGALMRCPKCGKSVKLRAADIKRQVTPRTDGDDDVFRVALVEHPAPPAAPASASASASAAAAPTEAPAAAATGDTTIEPELTSAVLATAPPPAAKSRKPGKRRAARPAKRGAGSEGAVLAQQLARRRRMITIAWCSAGAAVVLTLVIVLVVNMGDGNGDGANPDGGPIAVDNNDPDNGAKDNPGHRDATKDGSGGNGKDGATSKDGAAKDGQASKDGGTNGGVVPLPPKPPRLPAVAFGDTQWHLVSRPYRTAPISQHVALLDDRRVSTSAGNRFEASIKSRDMLLTAALQVRLINDEDRVYAVYQRPVPMLDGEKPRDLSLPIPPELTAGLATVDWAIEPVDAGITGAHYFQDTYAEPLNPQATLLKVTAFNGSEHTLGRTVFVVQALIDGALVHQWRVAYPHPVPGKDWVRFEVTVPIEDGTRVTTWRVLGAGISDGTVVKANDPPDDNPDNPDDPDVNPKDPPRRGLFDF